MSPLLITPLLFLIQTPVESRKHPAPKMMPLAKVDDAVCEVILSADDSMGPEKVEEADEVMARFWVEEKMPPVSSSPVVSLSPVPLIPPLNEDVAVVVTFTAPVINASPCTESLDVGDDVAIPRLPARSTMSAAVDDP